MLYEHIFVNNEVPLFYSLRERPNTMTYSSNAPVTSSDCVTVPNYGSIAVFFKNKSYKAMLNKKIYRCNRSILPDVKLHRTFLKVLSIILQLSNIQRVFSSTKNKKVILVIIRYHEFTGMHLYITLYIKRK